MEKRRMPAISIRQGIRLLISRSSQVGGGGGGVLLPPEDFVRAMPVCNWVIGN